MSVLTIALVITGLVIFGLCILCLGYLKIRSHKKTPPKLEAKVSTVDIEAGSRAKAYRVRAASTQPYVFDLVLPKSSVREKPFESMSAKTYSKKPRLKPAAKCDNDYTHVQSSLSTVQSNMTPRQSPDMIADFLASQQRPADILTQR